MSDTGFVYDPLCLTHDPGYDHPENQERLTGVIDHLRNNNIWRQLQHIPARDATVDEIRRVHDEQYIYNLQKWCKGLSSDQTLNIDLAPTGICGDSWRAAIRATGAGLAAVDAVLAGSVKKAFVAIRPPGHHAIQSHAMGFCLLNHVAIAARHAQIQRQVDRIFIIDWDIHHGNGTQDIFYEDGSVFFSSIHQQGIYPGTGSQTERGLGKGEGTTVNFPIPAWSDDDVFLSIFREQLQAKFTAFQPDLVLISAGFDCRCQDNNFSQTNLSGEGISRLTEVVKEWAEKVCSGRVISFLEGGYSPTLLPDSIHRHLEILAA